LRKLTPEYPRTTNPSAGHFVLALAGLIVMENHDIHQCLVHCVTNITTGGGLLSANRSSPRNLTALAKARTGV